MLDHRQRAVLIDIARTAVQAGVQKAHYQPVSPEDTALCAPAGAFVTLHNYGELRGCIGLIEPDRPLYLTIAHAATSAATQDFRFSPISSSEFSDLRIEISVLSCLEPVADPSRICVGTHGLVIEQGARRGLLLPQVAREWGWEREEFLCHTCEKAGLPASAWQTGASLFSFTALVFGEESASIAEHYLHLNQAAALALVEKYLTTRNLIKHCLATGAVLHRLAIEFGEDAPQWKLCGLVHDIDYDTTATTPDQHTVVGAEILAREGLDPVLIDAVKAHNDKAPRDTALAKALWATDPLTGFLVAAALMAPDKKIANVDVAFVQKRMKEKSFARAVNREQIAECAALGLSPEKFIALGLEAMQHIAPDLGL
jgi:uncharacterized protein